MRNMPLRTFGPLVIALAVLIPGRSAFGYMFCEDNDYCYDSNAQDPDEGGRLCTHTMRTCGEEGRPPYCICNDNRRNCGCYPGDILWRYFPLNCPLRYGCGLYHGMHQCDDPGMNDLPLLPSDYFCEEDGQGHGQVQSNLPDPGYPPLCHTESDCPSGNWCNLLRDSGVWDDHLKRGECRPYVATGGDCSNYTHERCAPEDYCHAQGIVCVNKRFAGDSCNFNGMCRSGQCVDRVCVGGGTGTVEVRLSDPTITQFTIISKQVSVPYTAFGVFPTHVHCDPQAKGCSFTHPQTNERVEMQFDYEMTQNETGLVLSVPVTAPVDTDLVSDEEDIEQGGLEAPIRIGAVSARYMVAAIEADVLNSTPDPVEVGPAATASDEEATAAPTLACYDISAEPVPRPGCLVFSEVPTPSTGQAASSGGGTTPTTPTISVPSKGSSSSGAGGKSGSKEEGTAATSRPWWQKIIGTINIPQGSTPTSTGNEAPSSPSSRPAGEEVIDYTYDGLGRLVRRKTNSTLTLTLAGTTSWTWFGPQRLIEYNSQTRTKLEFFQGSEGTHFLIQTVTQGSGLPPPSSRYALHQDHLRSTVLLTDETTTGEAVYRYFYDPYGEPHAYAEPAARQNPVFNPVRYTGQYYDGGAQTYLFPFRAYDPQIGRFLQPDPLGYFDGPNAYAYVHNAPYSWVDPLGLASDDPQVRIHLFVATARSLGDIAPQLNRAASDMRRALGARNTEIIAVPTGAEFAQEVNEIGERAKQEGVIHIIGVFSHSGSAAIRIQMPETNMEIPGLSFSQRAVDLTIDYGSGLYLRFGQGFYTRKPFYKTGENAATVADLNKDNLPFLAFGLFGCNSKSLGQALFEAGAAGYFATDYTSDFVTSRGESIPTDRVLSAKGPVHLVSHKGEIGARVRRDPNDPTNLTPVGPTPFSSTAARAIRMINNFISQYVGSSPPKHQRNN